MEKKLKNNERDLSKFNLALPYLNRINSLLSAISSTYIRGDLSKMCWCLKALYREISPKLSPQEKTKFETQFKQVTTFKSAFGSTLKQPEDNSMFLSLDKPAQLVRLNKQKESRNKFVEALENLDMLLREFLEARGMLVPNISDPRFLEGVE